MFQAMVVLPLSTLIFITAVFLVRIRPLFAVGIDNFLLFIDELRMANV